MDRCERVDVWEVDKLSEPSFMDGFGGDREEVWEVDTEPALPYERVWGGEGGCVGGGHRDSPPLWTPALGDSR